MYISRPKRGIRRLMAKKRHSKSSRKSGGEKEFAGDFDAAVMAGLGPDAWLTTAEENVEGVQFYKSVGFIVAATFPGYCQEYPCNCIRLVKPGSRHARRPPVPTQKALQLAGFTEESSGRGASTGGVC